MPIYRYIDIEDSEAIIRAIRTTPLNVPIMMILHTPGGLVLAASQIARALKAHPAKKVVVVPHYAMSGGTLIALAADEIIISQRSAKPTGSTVGRPWRHVFTSTIYTQGCGIKGKG